MNTECKLQRAGLQHRCIYFYPGQLEKYCDGCINYAKQKVIEKLRKK